jgi:glutaredoxin
MFTVYSKPNCPYCDQAKALLERKNEPFEVINLDVGQPKNEDEKYISRDDLLIKVPGARTMPQILKMTASSSVHIGGFVELKSFLG